MKALQIQREDTRPEYYRHQDIGCHHEGRDIPTEEWITELETKAEWRGFWFGGAWALLMGVLIGLAAGMPLGYYVFYRVVI
ncbi:hypothetical protein LCGC14_1059410 [marine sediment metagenome]|uniref:Uncharacterized protein n=1 Tax=marine sediment metagenome TaxID=412755 RepID=A0A0F9MR62_9ZZZZ